MDQQNKGDNKLQNFLNSNAGLTASEIKKLIDDDNLHKDVGFLAETEMGGQLINLYFFDIVEKIRFSKLQKESLRDTSTYNRHIAKALTEIRNALAVLFELKTSDNELKDILEKYLEFNIHVNTDNCWKEFDSLRGYNVFDSFVRNKDIEKFRNYHK
ncbi:hypothetical protein IWB18_04945 [Alkalibacter sp. M17DMB]|nr:hypothetical protein [Alkalibacter mobilis]